MAGGGPDPAKVYDLLKDLAYRDKGLHITFYHRAVGGKDLETVVYSATPEQETRVVMPPPAICPFGFNNGNRQYLISFKGRNSSGSGNHREEVFNKIKPYHDGEKIIIADKQDDDYDYADLMSGSEMLFIIEGDQPWSYRFTEAVNAGGIPVVVQPSGGDNVFPFSQILDYSKCCFFVRQDELDRFFEETIPGLMENPSRLNQMRSELREINDKYFFSRKEHVQGVLDTLTATHPWLWRRVGLES
jgi:hypothetical protein